MNDPTTSSQYDVAVVGAGPAGVSAAINVSNRRRSVVLLAGRTPFEHLAGPQVIANFAGLPEVTGEGLARAFRRQLELFSVPVVAEKVTRIIRDGEGADTDGFVLFGADEAYRARTVVFATGVLRGGTIEGEEDLLGQGVSYCVTCDGRLFAGRRVVFIGYGSPGEAEAGELADAFGAEVTYLPQYDAEPHLPADVRVLAEARPVRLARTDRGMEVTLADGLADQPLVADAVFVSREAVAPAALLDGLATDGPHLVVDRQMVTSVPGVFAAGDCTGEPYQMAKAVGQGQVAALSAVRLLRERAASGARS